MKSVTIYTGPLCNYCEAAKKLLARNDQHVGGYDDVRALEKENKLQDLLK